MTQESKSGWIYCLYAQEKNSTLYFLLYRTSAETLKQEIEKIVNKCPSLRDRLFQYYATENSDIEKAKKLIKRELTSKRLVKEIEEDFLDKENHEYPYIRATESFAPQLKQLMDKASNKSKQNGGIGAIGGILIFLFGSVFLIAMFAQFPNIQRNLSKSSASYHSCANGGGGRACKKLTKAYRDCEDNGGGTACEKLVK
jgi:hypothetical protein